MRVRSEAVEMGGRAPPSSPPPRPAPPRHDWDGQRRSATAAAAKEILQLPDKWTGSLAAGVDCPSELIEHQGVIT